MIDVGQGDAILIQNGGSTVLVDGGPDRRALAHLLDAPPVPDTIDAVVLTHVAGAHFEGLRQLFSSRRPLTPPGPWWNGRPAPRLAGEDRRSPDEPHRKPGAAQAAPAPGALRLGAHPRPESAGC